MKNKILTIFILGILLISFISFTSAWTSVDFTLDESKQIEMKDSITSYGKYEIKDYAWYDILKIWTEEKVKEVVLEENTPECSDNCFAIKEVTNLKPMPLIEDVRFFREIDGKWVSWNSFTNWRIEVEEDVDIFETQCIQGKEIIDEKNGTSYFEQDCSQVLIGTEKQWKPLDYKKDYEGTYRVKLSGGKKPDVKYDWQVKIGGEWTTAWAVWGGIGHDLLTYYSFEETSGDVIDLTGNANNGTVVGTVQRNVIGKINKGYNFTGSGYINITNTNYNLTEGFSVNMWINNSNTSNKKQDEYIFMHGDISVHIYSYDSNDRIRFNFNLFSGVSIYKDVTWNGEFVFISFGLDNKTKNPFACVNTDCWFESSYNYTPYTGYEEPQQTSLGGSSFSNWKGLIDELSIFDKALSESEILELYNSGNGYNPVITGRVSLNSPANNSIQYTNLVTTNATANVTNGAYLTNASLNLSVNGGAWEIRNTTNISGITDDGLTIGAIGMPNINDYGWKITATSNFSIYSVNKNPASTATKAYIKSADGSSTIASASFIGNVATFSSPISITNGISYRIVANSEGGYANLAGKNSGFTTPISTSYFNIIKGINENSEVDNQVFTWDYITTAITTTTTIFTNTFNAGDVVDFNYEFCDSDGDCGKSETRRFTIDSTAPTIDLISPNSTYNYLKQGDTLYLQGFANDSNLDTVWYEYNGTNTTFSATTATLFNESITQADSSKLSLTLWANDTIGNTNREVISWDYKVFENDRIYSLNAYETEMKDFIINLTYNSSTFVPTVYLNYDGTNYSTINIGSGNEGKFKNTVSIGLIDGSTSKEFYWWILANDSVIKTESNNQTINNLIFQICNGTYTNKTLNFKFYDESKNTLLNSTLNPLTFETYFEFWVGNGDIKKSYNYNVQNTTTGSYDFCISPANFSFNSNLQISYSVEDYSKRESSYNELNLTNIIQNISFYLLPTELSTKFTHYVRQEIEALAGVSVEVYKFLISTGNYTLISTKTTDENGRFVEWLELDQKYKYTVKSEGISLTEQEKQAICAVSPCEITLQIDEVSLNAFNELNAYFAQNVDYNLTYNKSTSTFKLSFLDLTGNANYWRLYVYKSNSNNDTLNSICNLYAYSSSGELECDTSLYFGEITAKVYISRSPEKLVDFLIRVNENITPVLSVSGLLASIIILLVIIFTGTRNPTSALLMLPFGLIILKFIGFMPLTWGWIAGITIFILAISYKMNT